MGKNSVGYIRTGESAKNNTLLNNAELWIFFIIDIAYEDQLCLFALFYHFITDNSSMFLRLVKYDYKILMKSFGWILSVNSHFHKESDIQILARFAQAVIVLFLPDIFSFRPHASQCLNIRKLNWNNMIIWFRITVLWCEESTWSMTLTWC